MRILPLIMLLALCGCSTQSLNGSNISYSEYHSVDCLSQVSTVCVHPDSGLSESDVSEMLVAINKHVGYIFPASGVRKRHIESQYEVALGSYSEIDAVEKVVIIEKQAGGWVVIDVVELLYCAG